jgi:hypothetical protein
MIILSRDNMYASYHLRYYNLKVFLLNFYCDLSSFKIAFSYYNTTASKPIHK